MPVCFYGNRYWKRQIHGVLNNFNSYLLPPSTVALQKKIQSQSTYFLETSGILIKLVQVPSHTPHFEIKRYQNGQGEGSAKDQSPLCSVDGSQVPWWSRALMQRVTFQAMGHYCQPWTVGQVFIIHGVLDGWAGALARCGPTPGRGVGPHEDL